MRYLTPLFLMTFLFLASCLRNDLDKPYQKAPGLFRNVKLYTFSSDDQYFLSNAQPFILPHDTSLRDTLDSLGRHLSETYFSKTYSNELSDIHFEVLGIEKLSTPSRPLLTAIVNMLDVNNKAMSYFFQGSTGGQATFCMLTGTFMQPHLDPPLLDGLIILYNGKLMPKLDHINLSGLLVPRLVEFVVNRAIHNTERKTVKSTHDSLDTELNRDFKRSEIKMERDSLFVRLTHSQDTPTPQSIDQNVK